MTFALLHLLKGVNMNKKNSFWIPVYIDDIQSKNHAPRREEKIYIFKNSKWI